MGDMIRLSRRFSSVSVNVDSRGVGVLSMHNGKVNMMDRQLMPALISNVKQLVDDGAKGLIIRSDVKNIFCAGLDIKELHDNKTDAEMEAMVDFWHHLQDSWLNLYRLEIPMVAAVNGAAIAGGCLIACCADTRVMINNPKYRIGYSAPMLGMVTPTFVMSTFEQIVGRREAELALMTAKLYNPEKAHAAGLIDVLVDDEDQLLAAAHAEMDKFMLIPPKARGITKALMRKDLLTSFLATRDENTRLGIEQLNDPWTQGIMGAYLASLGKK